MPQTIMNQEFHHPLVTPNEVLYRKVLEIFPKDFNLEKDDLTIISAGERKKEVDLSFARAPKHRKPIQYSFTIKGKEYTVEIYDDFPDGEYEKKANFWKEEVFNMIRATYSRAWVKQNYE